MMKIKMTIVYKVLTILMWTAISAGLMVLLVSAVRKERTMVCKAVQVEFTDSQPFRMLDEMEIISTLWPDQKKAFPQGKNLFLLIYMHWSASWRKIPGFSLQTCSLISTMYCASMCNRELLLPGCLHPQAVQFTWMKVSLCSQ